MCARRRFGVRTPAAGRAAPEPRGRAAWCGSGRPVRTGTPGRTRSALRCPAQRPCPARRHTLSCCGHTSNQSATVLLRFDEGLLRSYGLASVRSANITLGYLAVRQRGRGAQRSARAGRAGAVLRCPARTGIRHRTLRRPGPRPLVVCKHTLVTSPFKGVKHLARVLASMLCQCCANAGSPCLKKSPHLEHVQPYAPASCRLTPLGTMLVAVY